MNSSSEVPQVTTGGGLFSRGCKFRYSGRVEKEVVEETKNITRDQPHFQRTLTRPSSYHHRISDVYPSSPSTSPNNERAEDYNSLHFVNHSAPIPSNITAEQDDQIPSDDSLASPALNSLPADALDALEEENVGLTRADSLPLDPTLTPSDNFPEEISTVVNGDTNKINSSRDIIEADDEENTELVLPPPSTHQPSSARYIEDILPLDVKIPKRRIPATPSSTLPPHVNVMRVIVLASLFVLLLLSCLLIVVMESDSSLFSDIRKLPEMIILRREYYEPAKDYVVDHMSFLFKR